MYVLLPARHSASVANGEWRFHINANVVAQFVAEKIHPLLKAYVGKYVRSVYVEGMLKVYMSKFYMSKKGQLFVYAWMCLWLCVNVMCVCV